VADLVDDNPSITQHTVRLASSGTLGQVYRFKVQVYNQAGPTESSSLAVALASLPSQPTSAPQAVPSVTGPEQLGLQIELLEGPSLDGGSSILQYEVQHDDGARGPYRSIYTLSPLVIVSYGISRGLEYRARYRAMNFNGWGPFSDVAYIRAAERPGKPGPPQLLWSTSTQVAVQLSPTPDDGGSALLAYELYIDSVQATPAYELLSVDRTMTRIITFAPPATATEAEIQAWATANQGTVVSRLMRGQQCRLVATAVNALGASAASEELRIALGRLPDQPAGPPRKVESQSSQTSLMVEWSESPAVDGIDIEGYSLYMDDGHNGDFTQVYDGRERPRTFRFLAVNLTTGLPYRFAVSAHNLNGESELSSTATIYACLVPGNLPAPAVLSTTKTSIAISWAEPTSNGCPVSGFIILRNTGQDDDMTVSVDPNLVANLASLREWVVSGLTSTSSTYRLKVRALNFAGYSDSLPCVVVLAAVPDTPLTAPSSDALVTDQTKIKVNYGPLTAS
jgi:hypothetical protein